MVTINDLSPEEQEVYERITDFLTQECSDVSWYRIGSVLSDCNPNPVDNEFADNYKDDEDDEDDED